MFCVSDEVTAALNRREPVVALETAVLTHGFDKPQGMGVYVEMMDSVRAAGALPAPIGVVDGVVKVGLDRSDLEVLDRGGGVVKAAIPDLPVVAQRRLCAGTTVATTMWAAALAGVGVAATGGIGGVHRGASDTFDISGDMMALSRYGGLLVCSGAKIICDLAKTLELLETLGVTVAGYRTGEFPAFTVSSSGLRLTHRVDDEGEAAALARMRDRLGLSQAVVIAKPVAAEHSLSLAEVEGGLGALGAEAASLGVSGPGVTPHLLSAMARATGGASATANRALLVDNCALAARIARRLCEDEPSAR